MKRILSTLWKHLLTLLYPNFCLLCEETLDYSNDKALCPHCEGNHPHLKEDLCDLCGKPLADPCDFICYDCTKRAHYFEEGRSLWVYEGLVKQSIYDYKYKKRKEYGLLFAKELIRYYNETIRWKVDMVVPIPLHKHRLRERGFNQTELMVKHFAKSFDLQVGGHKVLWRDKPTDPQKALSDKGRWDNMQDAFFASKTHVEGKIILLIDDIYTTGSTMDACAKALKVQGAKEVYCLSIAIGRGM